MERPQLNNKISLKNFRDFYWLKEELVLFCKSIGIKTSGGKKELEERIFIFLETGLITDITTTKQEQNKTQSKFDWNNAHLTPETIITDNYKNSENVRVFFKKQIGNKFHFSTPFMQWMKNNSGKTLADAIVEWNRLNELKKDKNNKDEIAPQFEYNRYIRAFLADNPQLRLKDAIHYWNIKKQMRGKRIYEPSDLLLKA